MRKTAGEEKESRGLVEESQVSVKFGLKTA
jgi:hypothetical protein